MKMQPTKLIISVVLIILALSLFLTGCTSDTSLKDTEPPVLTLTIENEPPGFEEMPAPDFLTEEQQDLYKKAFVFRSTLLIESTSIWDFLYADNQTVRDINQKAIETVEIDGKTFNRVHGRYSRYDDLYAVMTSIFTEKYFNKRWLGTRYLPDDEGNTLVANGSRGTNIERTDQPDSYELVKETKKKIDFNVIGYYKREQSGEEYTKSFLNSMVLTEDGWRISLFQITA